jgi:serine/threonine protein kinase
MELLTGTDLENHLYSIEDRKERMPLPRVAEIFDPIVDTLEVAHNAGILHRDLKPANVFLLDGGGVRLLDFGMARLRKAAPLTAAGTVMGSPSFMAPEAWKGQSALVDKRADVYSLGVILFRVLAGDLPFSGTSLQHKFLGTTQSERPSLIALRPDLPRGADDWVAVALAIDREERFSNVRALWSSFLTALKLESPKRQNRAASFWTAAKQVMKRVAGSEAGSSKAQPNAEDSTEGTGEPSFGTQALARSVMHLQPLAPHGLHPAVEETVELTGSDLQPVGPPSHATGGVEKTLELEAADLALDQTLPIGAQAPPTATPAVDKPVANTGSPPPPPRRPR